MRDDGWRWIDVDGHRLAARAYNEDAAGTPIVVIHGVLASANFWQAGAPEVLRRRRWYALSLPAHYPARAPETFRRNGGADAAWFARLIGAAVHALCGEAPAILIGHSTGGFAALNLAARQPQRVRAVVAVGGFAQGPFNGLEGWVQKAAVLGGPLGRALFALQLRLIASHRLIARLLSVLLAARWRGYWRWPHLRAQFRDFHPDTRHWDRRALYQLFRGIHQLDIRSDLAAIRCPVLVLAGTRDPVIPASQPPLLLRGIAGAEAALLAGVGHMPFAEAPDDYARAIASFIDRLEPIQVPSSAP